MILDAHLAMTAYAPIYTAGCLKDAQTSMYCYANAVTNISNPSMVYFYYLPMNVSLPGITVPSCSPCLQQTMNVFQAATANRQQHIANTYPSAAQQVNTVCGPTFVNETLATEIIALSSGASTRAAVPFLWTTLAVPLLAALPWLL